ncbi:hypothetical protein BC943DRAFT_353722 [Umbelopsis sp. AD052]|nr:hypothetical protein BC943DRAFT_353722 [Umbelopsis sp. AD052]
MNISSDTSFIFVCVGRSYVVEFSTALRSPTKPTHVRLQTRCIKMFGLEIGLQSKPSGYNSKPELYPSISQMEDFEWKESHSRESTSSLASTMGWDPSFIVQIDHRPCSYLTLVITIHAILALIGSHFSGDVTLNPPYCKLSLACYKVPQGANLETDESHW